MSIRSRSRSRPAWTTPGLVLVAATLTACDGFSTAPALPGEDPTPLVSAPPQLTRGLTEGYRTRGEVRTGYSLDRNGQPVEITYEVHEGLAVFERDIVLGPADEIPATAEEALNGGPLGRGLLVAARGVVVTDFASHWPAGIVPYEISSTLPNQSRVANGISIVERQTPGVVFVPRSGQADYVRFVPATACTSPAGRQGGEQPINLASDCDGGAVAHEILHALGMRHEQARCDRDAYVFIVWDNIEDGEDHNFTRHCTGHADIGIYSEYSLMHYAADAFSKNGEPTIISLRSPPLDDVMGQRSTLSATDIQAIDHLYGVFNDPPTARIGALSASYPEGSAVTFDGTVSSDPDDPHLEYRWTFGDGTCLVASPPLECWSPTPSHTYADQGVYDVTLKVSDGFLDDETSATVTVVNVPPVVDAGADATLDEGEEFTGAGTFSDSENDNLTATVDYDDGAGPEPLAFSNGAFSLSHTYADNGVYDVTVTFTDDEGDAGSDQVIATVNNVAPDVTAGPDASIDSGDSYSFSASFSDPGVYDAPWDYSLDWGFGVRTLGSTSDQSQAITDTRRFCGPGDYSVELFVTDKDGGTGSDATMVAVAPLVIAMDITPTSDPNPVSLRNRGQLPVAILGTPTFDPTAVDVSTLTLGDESGPDTPVTRRRNSTYIAAQEDVNGDGTVDLVVMFEVSALVRNGDLTESSAVLTLRGLLADGCTHFRGEDTVWPLP